MSIHKIVRTLRAARPATARVNGAEITLDPEAPPAARELLGSLGHAGH